MSRTPNRREAKAYEAMEVLGLNRSFIKPILKELLKVYANEWSYIEAENYRLLADQAFEQQETVVMQVKQESTSSPRRTRASTSGTDKGKKKIEYGDTRSADANPPKPAVAVAAVSTPPLPARVKLEKDPDSTPTTLPRSPVREKNPVKTLVAERSENRSARDGPDNGAKLDGRGAVSPAKIDARTLEETLRQVTSSHVEVRTAPGDTVEPSGAPSEFPVPEERTNPLNNGDHEAEGNHDELATIGAEASHVEVPEPCIIDSFEPSPYEEAVANTSGPESVLEEPPTCANGVPEDHQAGADVLSLLADSYSEDKDEPKVATIDAAPDPAAVQTSVEGQEDVPLAEVREELPLIVSPDVAMAEEETPDLVLPQEDTEQLELTETEVGPDSGMRTAELIRPRFLVNKELPGSANGDTTVASRSIVHESPTATGKRELSDPPETAQPKRVKYETEADGRSNPVGVTVSRREGSQDSDSCRILEGNEIRATRPGAAYRGNLATLASNSPVPLMGPNRRKLILSDSPSPEASPLADRRATSGLPECVRINGGAEATPASRTLFADRLPEPVGPEGPATSAEVKDMALVTPAPVSVRSSRRLSSRSLNGNGSGSAAANGACATVATMVREPEDLDDDEEEQVVRKKSAHSTLDISRGTERVRIPFLNEYSSDTISSSFKYIRVNTVFQDAYVNFSLARVGEDDSCGECSGDCLEATFPCACTRETGGVFAYTRDGCLKKEFLQYEVDRSQNEDLKEKLVSFCASGWFCPTERSKNPNDPESCKGHVSRKFIKECWHKCGCSMGCGNRVVQRGITRQLQIFFTQEGKGWGLRTLEQIPPGAFVCEYVGEILTNVEQEERNNAHNAGPKVTHTYPVLLDGDWCSEKGLKDEEALCLDATFFGNAARFINHRCFDANLIDMPVTIESPDRHYYHVAFFTSRAVNAMEELTWDYKIDFDDDEHPIAAFQCLCGSPFCRGASSSTSSKKRKKRCKK